MSLKLSSVTKSFGEKTLFRDLSYNFEERGIYAIVGDSGIGKSTLLRLIAGLDRDYSGSITGGGITASSFCFQEHRLFPTLSAFDNVYKVSFKTEDASAKEATLALLRRLKFSDPDMRLKPSELSGGMRQRIAFARAILKESDILILDEATKELDRSLIDTVLEIIKEQGEKRLVITVTHKDEEISRLGATVIDLANYV